MDLKLFIKRLLTKFPTEVIIRELVGNQIRFGFDVAARIKRKDGTEVMWLKNRDDYLPAPTGEHYGITKRGRKVLELFSPKEGIYIPIKFSLGNPNPQLHLADSKVDEWLTLENLRLAELTKPENPWWQQNFHLIGGMVMIGLMAFVLLLTFQHLPIILGQLAGVANEIKETARLQTELLIKSGIAIPPPKVG